MYQYTKLNMPRRSKAELSPETIAELEEQFFKFINTLSPDETNKFFNEFLTNEEKMMMYKRLALYWSLFEGYSLASIQRMLGVTHDTTRIYNKKKNVMSDEFKDLLHRIGRSNIQDAITEPKEKKEENDLPQEAIIVEEPVMVEQPEEEKEADSRQDYDRPSEEVAMDKHDEEEAQEFKGESEDMKAEQAQDSNESMENEMKETGEKKEEEMAMDKHDEEEMKTESKESMENEMKESSEKNDEEEKDNKEDGDTNEEPKKKKGFGRFFGF